VSTETVLGSIGLHLVERGYQVERIIHCGQTIGVYDADGKTIPELNSGNIEQYRGVIGGSGGTDVTGGMEHKVFEALELARQGIPGLIIDGIEHGTLSDAIAGREVLGTRIEA
jgi:isopentenyl phosphate kinase